MFVAKMRMRKISNVQKQKKDSLKECNQGEQQTFKTRIKKMRISFSKILKHVLEVDERGSTRRVQQNELN